MTNRIDRGFRALFDAAVGFAGWAFEAGQAILVISAFAVARKIAPSFAIDAVLCLLLLAAVAIFVRPLMRLIVDIDTDQQITATSALRFLLCFSGLIMFVIFSVGGYLDVVIDAIARSLSK